MWLRISDFGPYAGVELAYGVLFWVREEMVPLSALVRVGNTVKKAVNRHMKVSGVVGTVRIERSVRRCVKAE